MSIENAKNDKEGTMNAVFQSVSLGTILSSIALVQMLLNPKTTLEVTEPRNKNVSAISFAEPYLVTRVSSVVPSVASSMSFASAFRGMFDFDAPLHAALFASIINKVLRPMLTFECDLGVKGAAASTLTSECASTIAHSRMLKQRNMILSAKSFQMPNWKNMSPLRKGGDELKLRNASMNATFECVSRVA